MSAMLLMLAACGGTEPSEQTPPGLRIVSIGPSAIVPNAGPLFLTVHGAGFQHGAVIQADTTDPQVESRGSAT